MIPSIKINYVACKKDGLCVLVCPRRFSQPDKKNYPEIHNIDSCIGCGHCLAICPHEAIIHSFFIKGDIRPVKKEILPTVESLNELLMSRRSIRLFNDTKLAKEEIERIIDAARFAPSSHNSQSTKFVIIEDKNTINEISRLTVEFLEKIIRLFSNPILRLVLRLIAKKSIDSLSKEIDVFRYKVNQFRQGNDTILYKTQVLLLFYSNKHIGFACENATMALHNATLMATTINIGSFYTGFVVVAAKKDKKIRKLLNLPPDHEIYGGLALGYLGIKINNVIERNKPDVLYHSIGQREGF
jgi:nitroreductase/NAD-dependent dihydropyrimidine dehydrogenase PreA subunit